MHSWTQSYFKGGRCNFSLMARLSAMTRSASAGRPSDTNVLAYARNV
jgi:hypothetical protein